VSVDGELSQPRLELAKHPEFTWITAAELVRLDENRAPGDTVIRDVVASAITLATASGASR
ncbi:MAG: NTP pyrophosphohydrolase, partial [Actinomycetes bacterium]